VGGRKFKIESSKLLNNLKDSSRILMYFKNLRNLINLMNLKNLINFINFTN